MPVTTVGVDADDTLWHNEGLFRLTHERFVALLSERADPEELGARLDAVERRNMSLYGYGVKAYTLSLIETAMELCDGDPPPGVIREILAAGREMLSCPIEPLAGVQEALTELSARYRLVLVTKGDLLDQERKLAASGLGDHFNAVEVVSEKTPETYRRVFSRHGTGAEQAAMIGNSMRSDVIPAIEAGAWGIYVPYPMVWSYEVADAPEHPRFVELPTIADAAEWLAAAERLEG